MRTCWKRQALITMQHLCLIISAVGCFLLLFDCGVVVSVLTIIGGIVCNFIFAEIESANYTWGLYEWWD